MENLEHGGPRSQVQVVVAAALGVAIAVAAAAVMLVAALAEAVVGSGGDVGDFGGDGTVVAAVPVVAAVALPMALKE